jgi:hypothetical protein
MPRIEPRSSSSYSFAIPTEITQLPMHFYAYAHAHISITIGGPVRQLFSLSLSLILFCLCVKNWRPWGQTHYAPLRNNTRAGLSPTKQNCLRIFARNNFRDLLCAWRGRVIITCPDDQLSTSVATNGENIAYLITPAARPDKLSQSKTRDVTQVPEFWLRVPQGKCNGHDRSNGRRLWGLPAHSSDCWLLRGKSGSGSVEWMQNKVIMMLGVFFSEAIITWRNVQNQILGWLVN